MLFNFMNMQIYNLYSNCTFFCMFYLYICTMEVTQIVINGIIISTLDKPIGLEVIKLSLDRDFQYSCVDTKIEAELKFYCASGKTELDEEYESKGVEGSGYIEITDSCGPNAETYTFNLDFKKYNNQGDFTTVGLIEANSLWKKDLDKQVNLTTGGGILQPFYIRNLPLEYDYSSENIYSKQVQDTDIVDLVYPGPLFVTSNFPLSPSYLYFTLQLNPRSDLTLNELEDGAQLISEFLIDVTNSSGNVAKTGSVCYSVGGGLLTTSFNYSELEPPEIFHNTLEDGVITLETTGDTGFDFDLLGSVNMTFEYWRFSEVIAIGENFNSCRIIQRELNDNTLPYGGLLTNINYPNASVPTLTNSHTFEVKRNEKIWIWYTITIRNQSSVSFSITGIPPLPTWTVTNTLLFIIQKYFFNLNRDINANFKITKNVKDVLVNSADIIPYHTETNAYRGDNFLNTVFGTVDNIVNYPCYNDLWFTRGDYLRGKINVADFIVKPSDFFRELEKVVCCGLGYFYNIDPDGEKKLMSVYDFYSDTLVPSQYQFSDSDLIDGIIEIAPFLSPYCKEINIGYSNSKDSPKDFCKQNSYSVNNDSDSIYSKVSEFIASMYTITRALRLGTVDEELEFDNNIFILSGKTVSASPSNLNVTSSQTTGYLADSVETFPTIDNGINRRYSTAFNLFRHLYKWGFSLFNNKDTITAKKYEGNTIYDYDIRDLSGSATPYYIGLNDCKLPVTVNMVKVDKTIDNLLTDLIENAIYVPSQITFKTAKLSSLDLIAMRAHQYDLFSVSDGTNTYYGNLISANLEDDVTEIKLLRRFKDGL